MNRSPFTANPPPPPTPTPPTGAFANQPLITIGAITGVFEVVANAAVEFGFRLTPGQETAIEGVLVALAPFIVIAWGWFKVYSFASAQRIVNKAAVAGSVGADPPKV